VAGKGPALNRSLPLTTKRKEQYEKIHQLTDRRFAGAGWSRDGPTANAGRITKQKSTTGQKGAG
jgi:hypothetical protein